MIYEDALAFIHGSYRNGVKNGLSNMVALMDRLGNPQNQVPAMHVAGTNGKGSVCAYLQAALRRMGYRTGLYTSPFLQRYNERIRLDGKPIADDDLAELMTGISVAVDALRSEGIRPTEFEIGTALAFAYFARVKVDIAVVEVGLGGRQDPTNVITPLVAGIASIGLDHTHVLGDTEQAIAYEKAGIAKPGVPLVLSGQAGEAVRETIRAHCEAVGAVFSVAGRYENETGLFGEYQKWNAGLAEDMLAKLWPHGFRIRKWVMREGFSCARWPGRLEWVPFACPLLLDGAHNPQGAESLRTYVRALPKKYTVLLFGVMRDKDFDGIVERCAGFADHVVAVTPDAVRGVAPSEIAALFQARGIQADCCATVRDGLLKARELAEQNNGQVVVAGSLYLVGEVRTLANAPECELLDV